MIRSIFGNSDSCQEAANIINDAGGTQSFKLMKLAAHEKNKRNCERLLDLRAIGQHPWQQLELIKRHCDCLLDLIAIGQHPFLQPELIERNRELNRDRLLDLSAIGKHNFQQPELIECHRDRLLDLSAIGQHPFQLPEFIEHERENRTERANEIFAQRKHNFVTENPAKKRLKKLFDDTESTHYIDMGGNPECLYIDLLPSPVPRHTFFHPKYPILAM